MDRLSLTQSIEQRYGAFVNVTEVAEFLKVHRGTARQILAGLPYLENGKEKNYFARDVADRLVERKRI